MIITRPHPDEYPSFYETYIKLIQNEDVLAVLEHQESAFYAFVKAVDTGLHDHRYAEGKWSLKEVIGHIVEVERIMAYRALAISRGDSQSLPGMDENAYIANGNYSNIAMDDLAEEFKHARRSNIFMIKSFSQEMLEQKGIANNASISVAALIYIIAGHLSHHVHIINERYL